MKKMNLLVMSLVSAAALSFTSCSSNDDLAGNAGQEKVDGFYMTLTVQTPNASGTRTVQSNEYDATVAESKITSGKFFLMDSKNKIVFHKEFKNLEWDKTGKTQLEIPVENVIAGAEYKVYFLANADSDDPLNSTFSTKATTDNKFVGDYAKADNFAMFNENDKDVKGNSYTVTFTDENKSKDNAAKVGKAIKLERVTARIDQPTSKGAKIIAYPTDKDHKTTDYTAAEKKAMDDAVAKVENIELTRYAISNVANTTNIMQKWNDAQLLIPSSAKDFKYIQPTDSFGTKTLFENAKYFNAIVKDKDGKVKDAHKDYVFENNNANAATSMYFEYKVTLKEAADKHKDFTDGTFYRYNNIIYTSFEDIFAAYNDVKGLFNDQKAGDLKTKVENAKKAANSEAELDKLRQEYDIEIFNEGKTYYKMAIRDQFIGYANAIQRNTVYQLNVKNVFNVGAQVPNGTPDKDGLFYLDVEVSVNPWVLNSYDVDLQ